MAMAKVVVVATAAASDMDSDIAVDVAPAQTLHAVIVVIGDKDERVARIKGDLCARVR